MCAICKTAAEVLHQQSHSRRGKHKERSGALCPYLQIEILIKYNFHFCQIGTEDIPCRYISEEPPSDLLGFPLPLLTAAETLWRSFLPKAPSADESKSILRCFTKVCGEAQVDAQQISMIGKLHLQAAASLKEWAVIPEGADLHIKKSWLWTHLYLWKPLKMPQGGTPIS